MQQLQAATGRLLQACAPLLPAPGRHARLRKVKAANSSSSMKLAILAAAVQDLHLSYQAQASHVQCCCMAA